MRHAPRVYKIVLSIMKRCKVITCSGHGVPHGLAAVLN